MTFVIIFNIATNTYFPYCKTLNYLQLEISLYLKLLYVNNHFIPLFKMTLRPSLDEYQFKFKISKIKQKQHSIFEIFSLDIAWKLSGQFHPPPSITRHVTFAILYIIQQFQLWFRSFWTVTSSVRNRISYTSVLYYRI